ncbi:hypothetical protein AMI01nite_15080 [Aneurinibacillus migulanus]|nr:hypothetical protein AMI01nite_15080 [Aneurinibacillus migulanus]
MFMVRDKKRRKGDGWERSEKDMLAFLLPDRRAHPISSFFRIASFQPHSPVKISSVIYISNANTKAKVYEHRLQKKKWEEKWNKLDIIHMNL